MDPSSGQLQQQMSSQSLENVLSCSSKAAQQERKPRPQSEAAQKCPRCDSTNTKFCYYNNYSFSQPRYFCKSCRRYWTKGGTLRNVPVGGGCRKNKRSSSSSNSSSKRAQHPTFTPNANPLITSFPHLSYDHHSYDLSQAMARLQNKSGGQFGDLDDHDLSILGNSTGTACDILGMNPLDALRSGFLGTQSTNLQNLYYAYGNGDMGEVDNGSNSCGVNGVSGDMMMLPYDHEMSSNAATQAVTVATMKQEVCNGIGREQSENKVFGFGGFPWQLNGDTNMDELVDSARASNWNGFTSSWHGLLHSPLM